MSIRKKHLLELQKEKLEEMLENINCELEAIREEETTKLRTVWDLDEGDMYFCLTETGHISLNFWYGHVHDRSRRDLGTVFLNKEDAEDERRRRKLISKAKKSQGGFKPAFGDGTKKWCIRVYQKYQPELQIDWQMNINVDPALGWWPTEESADAFIEENRAELEWYFGQEEAE